MKNLSILLLVGLLLSCSDEDVIIANPETNNITTDSMRLFSEGLDIVTTLPANAVRVLIITGQSNADGRASSGDLTTAEKAPITSTKIWTGSAFNTYDYGVNDDGDGTGSSDHGFDSLLAYQFNDYFPSETLYIIKHAVGATEIAQHITGGSVYNVLYPRVQDAINNLIADGKIPYVYFLFSQGERDANIGTTEAAYYSSYETLIALWRSNLGVTNITLATTEILLSCYPNEPAINSALNNIGTDYAFVKTIQMKNLTDVGDGLHYDNAALRVAVPNILQWFKDKLTEPVTSSI